MQLTFTIVLFRLYPNIVKKKYRSRLELITNRCKNTCRIHVLRIIGRGSKYVQYQKLNRDYLLSSTNIPCRPSSRSSNHHQVPSISCTYFPIRHNGQLFDTLHGHSFGLRAETSQHNHGSYAAAPVQSETLQFQ